MIPLRVLHPVPAALSRRTRPGSGYARVASEAALPEIPAAALVPIRGRPQRFAHAGGVYAPLQPGFGPYLTVDRLAGYLAFDPGLDAGTAEYLRERLQRTPLIAAWEERLTRPGRRGQPRSSRGVPEADPASDEATERCRAALRAWIARDLVACEGAVYKRVAPLWRWTRERGPLELRLAETARLGPAVTPPARGDLLGEVATIWFAGHRPPSHELDKAATDPPGPATDDDVLRATAGEVAEYVAGSLTARGDAVEDGPAACALRALVPFARIGAIDADGAAAALDHARAALGAAAADAFRDRAEAARLHAYLVRLAIPRLAGGTGAESDEADLGGLAP